MIKDAIMDNDFLKNLDSVQLREVVECMFEKAYSRGQFIIQEGEQGQLLYVSAGQYDWNFQNSNLKLKR